MGCFQSGKSTFHLCSQIREAPLLANFAQLDDICEEECFYARYPRLLALEALGQVCGRRLPFGLNDDYCTPGSNESL